MEEKKMLIIKEIEKEHRKQRSWQRLVNDEVLNIEYLKTLSVEQLETILKSVKK